MDQRHVAVFARRAERVRRKLHTPLRSYALPVLKNVPVSSDHQRSLKRTPQDCSDSFTCLPLVPTPNAVNEEETLLVEQEPLTFLHIDVTEVSVLRKLNKRKGCGSIGSQGHNRLMNRHDNRSRERDDTTRPGRCRLESRVKNCVLSPAGHFLHVADV